MTAADLEHWQREMDLVRAFSAFDPMSGWDRMRTVAREIEAQMDLRPDQAEVLGPLLSRARWLAEQQRAHALEWQAAAGARHEHFERTEHENLRLPLSRSRGSAEAGARFPATGVDARGPGAPHP